MAVGSRPHVTRLPPSPSLVNDHHGPEPSGVILPVGTKPRFFQNPWKSCRSPTLTDAWTAYQKGAAIALPIHKTAGPSKVTSFSSLSLEPEQDDDDPQGSDNAIRVVNSGRVLPRSIYVRPEFSVVSDQDEEDDWRDPPVEVISPRWEQAGDEEVNVTWLGHAGVMVRIPWKGNGQKTRGGMCGVLFDPIFSYRCSPSQYVGPARYLDPPCSVADLPDVHICAISHDHYDHLDYYTIVDLWKHHESTIHFFVPFGLKAWFTSSGIPGDRVTELDWWHEVILNFASPSQTPFEQSEQSGSSEDTEMAVDANAALTLKVVFTPAQHRSGRGVFDQMKTLWGSWCVGVVEADDRQKAMRQGMKEWSGFKLFFGGDTGYRYATAPDDDLEAICPAFNDISDLYSPFTLSLLPLSTGSSLPFLRTILSLSLDQYTLTSSQHCSPGDAVEMHKILKSQRTLGIHWGTFCDGDEARGTRVEFGRARRDGGVCGLWHGGEVGEHGRFVTSDIGYTLVMPNTQ